MEITNQLGGLDPSQLNPHGKTGHAAQQLLNARNQDRPELRDAFDQFVGETFYGQMLHAMRQTVGKPAYFHGGRAEEVFQGQLDQMLAEQISKATSDSFTGPMFDLFNLPRS
jgi:hypothetical protein